MRWQKKRWSSNNTFRSTDNSGILQCFRGTTVWAARGGLDMHVPGLFLLTDQMAQKFLKRPRRRRTEAAHADRSGAVYQSLTYLVRDLTPVTGELVVWFPFPTEPESLLNGGLQYVVRFAPLLPPAIVDTPTAHLFQLFW